MARQNRNCAAAIAIGVGVTALTGGAALPALVAGVKAACVAGAISAGTSAATTAVRSAVSGDSFSTVVQKSAKAAVDGFADRLYGRRYRRWRIASC